ncbi:MAG: anthranilate synthase component I [Zetaproteobacteria bacterium CG06_land_8_20_14_3_00_59_53]|nr:MAG: anthranilate synthase component I [Zetaproteobacteria bacterium CG2_30_59_37]PIO88965.1 MAG: anthranilate synthase component I [Zetaproteobacteria bacterium CG23_combo_of_CG06-09_8_20_14_all_59_86]PIQ65270.1 MAG: anthranilate synthase component I [Zetaproteobacteria bacterium CG11_big_fil_rev_8_21_14_0_20_59_439]PIU70850.1 MAG: anthranilate synthase component I [Zetaproteobacteria bacterium CG06_land_8_20_14_3_00_59_53]PIU96519.1 MAG: anthranilate synthase component I [Zetaproteobacteri
MQLYRRTLSADCLTPPAVFARLLENGDCFLLESAEGGERWGRFSILAISPACRAVSNGSHTKLRFRDGSEGTFDGDILEWLRQQVIAQPAPEASDLPFAGGAVGFFGYQLVSHFEGIPSDLPDPVGAPESAFLLVDRFMVFDNLRGTLIICARLPADAGAEAARVLDGMEQSLYKGNAAAAMNLDAVDNAHVSPEAQTTQADFEAAVSKAKEYILAGDIFQVVLSQRFSKQMDCTPFDIYRAVRYINPSPYLFYLHIGDTVLVGSSPEILVRKDGNRAIVRPIAGTRPRGKTIEQDAELADELLHDTKELAEHVMLVDLGRNDLGRVCDYGTVKLTESMVIERYSHVMHIVSQVEGTLRAGADAIDLLAATFPAGTVSGAPKVRAMQIIHELEPVARGPYAGCVGYLGYGGERMDTAIAIRTAVIHDGKVHIQAGAGIVADSVPEREHIECVNKATAMFRAVALAEAQIKREVKGQQS